MVYLVPTAGLGNRLRVVSSVYNYCVKNNIPIRILWMREPGFNASFNDLFELSEKINVNNNSVLNFFLYSKPSLKNFYISRIIDYFTNRKIIYGLGQNSISKVDFSSDIYINTYYPQGDVGSVCEIFKPNNKLMKEITSFRKNFSDLTIGIHIRRTDNLESKNVSSLEKFELKIKQAIHDYSNVNFYLCTDDCEVKNRLKSKFGCRILTYNAKLSRNMPRGIKDAVIELWLLASTKEIWGSYYSSYSEMASNIYGTPLKIVK